MQRNMGYSIVAEAARRLAPSGGTDEHRPDLFLADYRPVRSDTQRVMVSWGSSREIPCVQALENWVLGSFGGTVKMDHASLRFWPTERCASFIVSWLSPTRRIADSKKMARVAPNTFLEGGDEKIVWEVRKGEDGTPYLIRKTEEDLGALLEEKKRAAAYHGRSVDFSRITSAGMLVLDVGDTVQFHHQGLTRAGHIKRFEGDDIIVASGKETYRVAAPAIIEMVQKDPKTVDDYKSRVRSYWRQIFPADYMNKWLGNGRGRQASAEVGEKKMMK